MSFCMSLAVLAWLNNCVGFRNHRYFFLYMAYMVIGVLFIIICGFDLAYTSIWLAHQDSDEPELEGHPVKFNKTGALIPVTDTFYVETVEPLEMETTTDKSTTILWERRAIIYMALINSGMAILKKIPMSQALF